MYGEARRISSCASNLSLKWCTAAWQGLTWPASIYGTTRGLRKIALKNLYPKYYATALIFPESLSAVKATKKTGKPPLATRCSWNRSLSLTHQVPSTRWTNPRQPAKQSVFQLYTFMQNLLPSGLRLWAIYWYMSTYFLAQGLLFT